VHRRPRLRGFALEKLKLGWSSQQISGRLKKEINEGVRPKREYVNHNPSTNFCMAQRRSTRSPGNIYLEVIGNEDTGWAEEADQSKSRTGFRSGTDQQR
jgi:hypothetical protein